jgi:hypothetical protein
MEIPKNIWLNMSRNPKAIENPKLPYFKLSLPPQTEGGEWTEIGVAWKGKKDGNYGFKFSEGITVTFTKKEEVKKEEVPFD